MDALGELLWVVKWYVYVRFNVVVSLLYFGVVAYYDAKYRECPDALLYGSIPLAALMNLYSYLWGYPTYDIVVSDLMAAILALLIFAMARRGIVGKGDVFILPSMLSMNPQSAVFFGLRLPTGVVVMLLSTIYLLYVVAMNVVHNLRKWRGFAKLTRSLGVASRLFYFIAGRTMTIEEFKRSRFVFPLITESWARKLPRVEWEPLYGCEYQGVEGEYVIVAYGVPMALALFVGLVTFAIFDFIQLYALLTMRI